MSAFPDNLKPIDVRPIKRALISMYDKAGLKDFVYALGEAGVEIASIGSMAVRIAATGAAVTPIDSVTGFPEVLEGQVKTLRPSIHSGILADQRKAAYREQIAQLGIQTFDLVVRNSYSFQGTAASGVPFDECVEQIDIGGPSMARAAAKNHPSVAVVISPKHYTDMAEVVAGEDFTLEQRRILAAEAFTHTAIYDLAIVGWLADELDLEDVHETLDDTAKIHLDTSDAVLLESLGCRTEEDYVVEAPEEEGRAPGMPVFVVDAFEHAEPLRYGENPHQGTVVYRGIDESFEDGETDDEAWALGITSMCQLHGKAMSYNNCTDGNATLRITYDHERPCVVVIKYVNPYGIMVADDVAEAYRLAHACDLVSAFGGVIVANCPVSAEPARQIVPILAEVVLAPDYREGVLEVLGAKKNLRVLQVEPPAHGSYEFKQINDGLLVQERNDIDTPGDFPENQTPTADTPADEATLVDLEFVWRAVRAVHLDMIPLVKDGASVGAGMGQVNRVDSYRLTVRRADTLGSHSTGDAVASNVDSTGGARASEVVGDAPEQRSIGTVATSDAFLSFTNGLQVFVDAGVKAVVQPGGSVRDQELIDAANATGITMYLTGTRHFAH